MCYQPDRVLAGMYNQDMNYIYVKRSKISEAKFTQIIKNVWVVVRYSTHAPESQGCEPVDEWISVRGFALRNPVTQEAPKAPLGVTSRRKPRAATVGYPTWCSIKPWSFTIFLLRA